MKIAAITRYQCGQLRERLDELGWTMKALCDQSGVPYYAISNYINLRRRISKKHLKAFNHAFAKAGITVKIQDEWPEGWEGVKVNKVTQIEDVPTENLVGMSELKQLEAPKQVNREELAKEIEEMTGFLKPQEIELLWLREGEGWTLKQCAEWRGVTSARIRDQVQHILRRIRRRAEQKHCRRDATTEEEIRFDPKKHGKFVVKLPEVKDRFGRYRVTFTPEEKSYIESYVERQLNAGRDPGFKYDPERDDGEPKP